MSRRNSKNQKSRQAGIVPMQKRVTRSSIAKTAKDIVERKTGDSTSKQPRFGAEEAQTFYLNVLNWVTSLCEKEPDYIANSMERDKWLSQIWHLEPHLAGVLHNVVSIDTNRGWSLEGGRNQVLKYSSILHSWEAAPGIQGWRPGISSASLSYYTTDIGGLVELGRDSEQGPLRGLYHVDPTHCALSSDVQFPLTYSPPGGNAQTWATSDYMRMASMLNIQEEMNGLGYCAVSRCIELTKIMVAVYEHDRESLGAKAPKGVLFLHNVTEQQWDDAMEARKGKLQAEGYDYFNAVAILATLGGELPSGTLMALSSLPTGFDLQQFTSMLMYGYALCFGYDPSEFYPVQFGSLGRGTEMEVQHEKATGKGGLNFILAFQEQLQRPDILPASLQYEFDQRDEQAEMEQANVQKAWVDVFRELRETGLQFDQRGGIDRIEFRMLLADKNIIPKEWTEVEEEVQATDEEAPETSTEAPAPATTPTIPLTIPLNIRKLRQRERRILRDRLMSKPHILSAIERFPREDIVRYHWKKGFSDITTLWPHAETLLERMSYPSAGIKRDILYDTKDVQITDEDVEKALSEAEEIDPELKNLLTAEQMKRGIDHGKNERTVIITYDKNGNLVNLNKLPDCKVEFRVQEPCSKGGNDVVLG